MTNQKSKMLMVDESDGSECIHCKLFFQIFHMFAIFHNKMLGKYIIVVTTVTEKHLPPINSWFRMNF